MHARIVVVDDDEVFPVHARIVIVDDDEGVRRSVVRLLRAHGYDAAEAANGAEGIRMAVDLRPAAILMDLLMPGMDGIETTRQLKCDPRTASIPIIALTASGPPQDDQALFEQVLTKPCSPPELLRVLQRLSAVS